MINKVWEGRRPRRPARLNKPNYHKSISSLDKAREAAGPPVFSSRKHPVHLPHIERFNEPVIIFLTVCAFDRRNVLATDHVHKTLRDAWSKAIQYSVGHYLIMPDHVHLFCSPKSRDAEPIMRWVAYWKRLTSIALPELKPLWQRDGWDTQLRRPEHYAEKWIYVQLNPVRKGLAASPADWSYQGYINELRW